MARLDSSLISALADPFGDSFIDTFEQLGVEATKKRKEAERRQQEIGLFDSFLKGNEAARTGNLDRYESTITDIRDKLENIEDPELRNQGLEELSLLDSQRGTVENLKTTNDAKLLIQTEKDIERLEKDIEFLDVETVNFDDGTVRERGSNKEKSRLLQNKLRRDSLRQNPKVASKANDLVISAKIAEAKEQAELREALSKNQIAVLSAFPIDSPQHKKLEEQFERTGTATQLRAYKKKRFEYEEAERAHNEAVAENKPLTDEEFAQVKNVVPENLMPAVEAMEPKAQRGILKSITDTTAKNIERMATSATSVADKALVSAMVQVGLEELSKDADFFQLFGRDLGDEVEIILEDPEQVQLIKDLATGKSPSEVPGVVFNYLKQKFPNKVKKYNKTRETLTASTERFQRLINKKLKDKGIDPNKATELQFEVAQIEAQREVDKARDRKNSGERRRERRND